MFQKATTGEKVSWKQLSQGAKKRETKNTRALLPLNQEVGVVARTLGGFNYSSNSCNPSVFVHVLYKYCICTLA